MVRPPGKVAILSDSRGACYKSKMMSRKVFLHARLLREAEDAAWLLPLQWVSSRFGVFGIMKADASAARVVSINWSVCIDRFDDAQKSPRETKGGNIPAVV